MADDRVTETKAHAELLVGAHHSALCVGLTRAGQREGIARELRDKVCRGVLGFRVATRTVRTEDKGVHSEPKRSVTSTGEDGNATGAQRNRCRAVAPEGSNLIADLERGNEGIGELVRANRGELARKRKRNACTAEVVEIEQYRLLILEVERVIQKGAGVVLGC